ncbi:8173_t:CDS:2 [Racocetra fulgida]|uniref:8173_t:CDS:1 n=1 Tax=Racocetra fulgida TaxID=60492 RepID=A0A9N9BCV0_9GLOM|nr:8173_t:CDS:2 [Racocetra fulgida]
MNGEEEEKWFLTNENSKASLSPEIVSTQAIRDKDGLILRIKSKQQPSSIASESSICGNIVNQMKNIDLQDQT